MKNQATLYGIIGLLGGILITIIFAKSAVSTNNSNMMRMMGMQQKQDTMEDHVDTMMDHQEDTSMEGMVDSLEGKTGDDFDREFIDQMIAHHQGAIDMASLAKQNAKHQEIKDLANDIINAQTSEIDQMRQWLKDWEIK